MALRKIDISGMETVDTKVRGAPELAFVRIADMIVDERYQRSIERRGLSNIRKIARNFDWAKFSPVMLSRRENGQYAIIDGQHRSHAAALCGVTEVPAVVSELTIEQEAAAFSWINGAVTVLSQNQIFKAALTAFEPWAVQCDAAVRRADCRLMTSNYSAAAKKPGQVFCISVVRRFVEQDQAAQLATVLQGVVASKVRDEVQYYNSFGLSSLVPAVIAAGVTRPEAVTSFLNAHDLDQTATMVRRVQELPENKGKSFKTMFGQSVLVLMKSHMRREAS
jgi:PII-like signaling protein